MWKDVTFHDVIAGIVAIVLTAAMAVGWLLGHTVPTEIAMAWSAVIAWLFRGYGTQIQSNSRQVGNGVESPTPEGN